MAEVERDRFGVMYSEPLEIGECVEVVPLAALSTCQEELARVRVVIEEMKHDGDDYVLNYAERLDRALSSEATKEET